LAYGVGGVSGLPERADTEREPIVVEMSGERDSTLLGPTVIEYRDQTNDFVSISARP